MNEKAQGNPIEEQDERANEVQQLGDAFGKELEELATKHGAVIVAGVFFTEKDASGVFRAGKRSTIIEMGLAKKLELSFM